MLGHPIGLTVSSSIGPRCINYENRISRLAGGTLTNACDDPADHWQNPGDWQEEPLHDTAAYDQVKDLMDGISQPVWDMWEV